MLWSLLGMLHVRNEMQHTAIELGEGVAIRGIWGLSTRWSVHTVDNDEWFADGKI